MASPPPGRLAPAFKSSALAQNTEPPASVPLPCDSLYDQTGPRTKFVRQDRNGDRLTSQQVSQKAPQVDYDGTVERVFGRPKTSRDGFKGAIFVHAGAGFHSLQNEKIHLQACADAAIVGIKFLKAGASATEAVEATLRVLEDKEITNAGYGSNLSIDGTVECDATIVDHLGRSGACGAVPNIKNPICLAKLILDKSYQPLSLRRVPPNALIGEGAREFAKEHGIAITPNEQLISKNARDRYLRWQTDLRHAEAKQKEEKALREKASDDRATGLYKRVAEALAPKDSVRGADLHRSLASPGLSAMWNEGQPNSPYPGTPAISRSSPDGTPNFPPSKPSPAPSNIPRFSLMDQSGSNESRSSPSDGVTAPRKSQRRGYFEPRVQVLSVPAASVSVSSRSHPDRDGTVSPIQDQTTAMPSAVEIPSLGDVPPTKTPRGTKRPFDQVAGGEDDSPQDLITDTIGAIAIDSQGRIAAASSSGGIGMKHRGRLGPAALVGIGTAVVPGSPESGDGDSDDDGPTTVAAVTSGTGEHMATTMASQRVAERLQAGTRRGARGEDVPEDDENAVLENFIVRDFMGHPGVRSCTSAGAIGVMAVKKTRQGYYFHFAHNTDSFALASMGGADREPVVVMSRLPEGVKIAQGARKIRVD